MGQDTSPHYQFIRLEHRGPVSWIVLNRPRQSNALSNGLLDEFSDALAYLADNGGPVLAIRGEGRGFSAGYDIGEVGKADSYGSLQADPIEDHARLRRNVGRYLAIWDHPKPVIAAIHGYCMAGATQMSSYADITIVTDDARIGVPTIPIGGGYVTPLWVPLVGPKRAKELSFVPGNSIDGRTAVEWGWANHCVPEGKLIEAVESMAARIALTPPDVLRIKKLSINRAAEAAGARRAADSVSEMDALLHLAPSVVQLKQELSRDGLKETIRRFHCERTTNLSEQYRNKD